MSKSTTDPDPAQEPVAFLSAQWCAAMTALLRGSETFRRSAEHVDLVFANVVEAGPGGEVRYVLRIAQGVAEFRLGDSDDTQVTATMDYPTAVELARGELNMQNAFMSGRLHVSGDIDKLLTHQAALASLDSLRDQVAVVYP